MQTLTENDLAERSQEFRAFYESLKECDPRDGNQINRSALLALAGTERSEAESLLIEHIEGVGGSVIEALVDMQSQRGAIALKKYAERARGPDAVEVAAALWRIERWPHAQSMLIDVLEGHLKYFPDDDLDDFEAMGRADAARALGDIPDARTRKALLGALNDSDSLVRHWAQASLDVPTAPSPWWRKALFFWKK